MSDKVSDIASQIEKTTESISKMQDVLNVIQEIASQTNLLSHIQTRFWLWDFLLRVAILALSHIQTEFWLWDFLV